MGSKLGNKMLVKFIRKDGTSEERLLSRKDIMKLPVEERAVILKDQVDSFMRENPRYYDYYD